MNEFLINPKPKQELKLPQSINTQTTQVIKPIFSVTVSQLHITFKDGSISDFNNEYKLHILPDYIHIQGVHTHENWIYYKDNILGIWFKDC